MKSKGKKEAVRTPNVLQMTALWDREALWLRKLRLRGIKWRVSADLVSLLPGCLLVGLNPACLKMSSCLLISSTAVSFIPYSGQKPWVPSWLLSPALPINLDNQRMLLVQYQRFLDFSHSSWPHRCHTGPSHHHSCLTCYRGLPASLSTMPLPTSGVRAQV